MSHNHPIGTGKQALGLIGWAPDASKSEKIQRIVDQFEFSNIDGLPAFPNDSERIAFLSGRAGSFDICIMSLTGENFKNLTQGWLREK